MTSVGVSWTWFVFGENTFMDFGKIQKPGGENNKFKKYMTLDIDSSFPNKIIFNLWPWIKEWTSQVLALASLKVWRQHFCFYGLNQINENENDSFQWTLRASLNVALLLLIGQEGGSRQQSIRWIPWSGGQCWKIDIAD
jgi:hypothetical protein